MTMAENVRLALSLVARGEAPLGIVYETDAKIEPAVKVIGVFPDNTHDPYLSRGVNSKCQFGCGALFIILAYADSEVGLRKVRLQFPRKADLLNRFCPGASYRANVRF
jgi:hypothetical protein